MLYRNPTIEQIADEELERSNGNLEQAVAAMILRITGNPELYEALVTPLIRNACAEAVRYASQKTRSEAWHSDPVVVVPPTPQRGISALARVTARSLYDFPLWQGGIRLGDATRPELLESAQHFLAQGRDMTHKGKFQRLVANRLKNDEQQVRSVLSEKQLRQLQQQAKV